MIKRTPLVAAMVLALSSLLGPGEALAATFDVFFEVEYDPATRGPSIWAHGTLTDGSTVPAQSTRIEIELIQLSLVSSRALDGSTVHEATLAYNIGSSGQDGVRRGRQDRPQTAYAQLDITCALDPGDPDGQPRCAVSSVRASDRNKHRGHVTILK